ncbi:thiaminase II [Kiloniella laminariae]|uniref:Aminopyrimidine aminohydrolase n=1 Tax=Kiloniella laminariae TaxID=454162 RepID=A0ABT4LED7_9PROT|nr:thiaminase II [Kiloniella laminariae]MCZ4279460.1 thiaminase II [Kiloniella laminariae]
MSFYEDLKAACPDEWASFVYHPFVQSLGEGSLPRESFRHYLTQDYLFLKHFSRAYALAVFKSDNLEDMRQAAATMNALLNEEMELHISYCAQWGISQEALESEPEATANLAYTRFVIDQGLSGDLLDLLVALTPCVLGYAEIGSRLFEEHIADLENNPYRPWVETYSGSDYQQLAGNSYGRLERIALARLGEDYRSSGRWQQLCKTFATATRLEAGFWEMGLTRSM